MKYLKSYKIFEFNFDFDTNLSITKLDEYVQKIKTDCQPFVQMMKKELGSEINEWIDEVERYLRLRDSNNVTWAGTFVETDESEETENLKKDWEILGNEKFQNYLDRGIFYTSPFIFRGFGDGGSSVDTDEIFLTKDYSHREDRKPLDINIGSHKLLDEYFEKKFNVRLRSKGVFAGRYILAKGYGVPFLFFPVGNFDYYWSDKVRDLYKHIDSEEWYDEIYNYPDNYDNEYLRLAMNDIKHIVNSYQKNTGMGEAITSKGSGKIKDGIVPARDAREITFICDKHHLLNTLGMEFSRGDYLYIMKGIFEY